jgi:hypothetical protein
MFPVMVVRPTCVSLRWREEKSFGRLAFYEYLAPNGRSSQLPGNCFSLQTSSGKRQRKSYYFVEHESCKALRHANAATMV